MLSYYQLNKLLVYCKMMEIWNEIFLFLVNHVLLELFQKRYRTCLSHKSSFGSSYSEKAWWASYQMHKIAGCACAGKDFSATNSKGNPQLATPACITARASLLRHARAVMHIWIAKPAVRGETFPAFPVHAQPTILRVWHESHGPMPSRYIIS